MKRLFSLGLPLAAFAGLLGWLQPMPSLPEGHDGLCRLVEAPVETILCTVPLDRYALRLRAIADDGKPFETFEKAREGLDGARVRLMMNAGMYHEDRRPVGLAVQDGRVVKDAVLGRGTGNFSLRPNGIFFVENGRAFVRETERYLSETHRPELATQSGPMLLVEGKVHPRFIDGSDSRYVRNGVGVSADGRTVYLAVTRRPVNFYDFALFFRDLVGVENALFFDGQVCSLYYPDGGIDQRRDRLGPILAVTDR